MNYFGRNRKIEKEKPAIILIFYLWVGRDRFMRCSATCSLPLVATTTSFLECNLENVFDLNLGNVIDDVLIVQKITSNS